MRPSLCNPKTSEAGNVHICDKLGEWQRLRGVGTIWECTQCNILPRSLQRYIVMPISNCSMLQQVGENDRCDNVPTWDGREKEKMHLVLGTF